MSRPLLEFRTGSKTNYLAFRKKYPDINVDFKTWIAACRKWNLEFMSELMEKGQKLHFPHGMGKPQIVKYKPTTKRKNKEGKEYINRPINWPKTKELKKYVYYLNHHTDGWEYFIQWQWKDARGLKNSFIWKFEAARIHSRKLGALLKIPDGKHKDLYREANKRF